VSKPEDLVSRPKSRGSAARPPATIRTTDEETRKLLGKLAHDLRNVIGPIGNAAELLKRTQKLDAEGRKYVSLIERQNERLLALVETLRHIDSD